MRNSSPSQGSVSISSTIKLTTSLNGTAGAITNKTFNMSPFKTIRITWNSFGPTSGTIGLIWVCISDSKKQILYNQVSKNKVNRDDLIIDVDISSINEQAFFEIRSYSSRSSSGGEVTKIEFLC